MTGCARGCAISTAPIFPQSSQTLVRGTGPPPLPAGELETARPSRSTQCVPTHLDIRVLMRRASLSAAAGPDGLRDALSK
eukprot:8815214-Pyramimonas_sp.AAC.1